MEKLFINVFILQVFLLVSLQSVAQPESGGKWSAGIVFSPDYAYRRISYPDSMHYIEEHINELEHPVFGYTTGISLLYGLNKRMELETGLLYSSKGFMFRMPGKGGWQVPEGQPGFEGPENDPLVPQEVRSSYNYRYLDVPLKVNWYFHQSRVRLFLSAGVAGSYLLDEFVEQKLIFSDRTETNRYNEENAGFNPVVLSMTGGAGIEYPLSDRFRFRVNPEFRYAVTPVADTSGKHYLWSAGINTAVYFKLKKGGTSSHP